MVALATLLFHEQRHKEKSQILMVFVYSAGNLFPPPRLSRVKG